MEKSKDIPSFLMRHHTEFQQIIKWKIDIGLIIFYHNYQ
jgi:hypothetical protein